jgi:hypothetical protein
MKKVLGFAAVAEAATGLALIVIPSLVVRLLFGIELANISLSIARLTGMALLGLGIACWPGCTPLFGMLTYSGLATLYLGYIAVRGELVGILLWPAVVLHAALTLLLARACFKPQRDRPA